MTTAILESPRNREASIFRPTELLRRLGAATYDSLISFEARATALTLSQGTLEHLAYDNEIDHVVRDRLVAQGAIRGTRL